MPSQPELPTKSPIIWKISYVNLLLGMSTLKKKIHFDSNGHLKFFSKLKHFRGFQHGYNCYLRLHNMKWYLTII